MEAIIEPFALRRVGMTAQEVRQAIAKYLLPDKPKPPRKSYARNWNGYPKEQAEEIRAGILEFLQDGEWHHNFEIAEANKTTSKYVGRVVNRINTAGTHTIIHRRLQEEPRPKQFRLMTEKI